MSHPAAGGLLSRFAHLTGGIAAKAKADDEDDKDKDKKDAGEGDEDEGEKDKKEADDEDEGEDARADEEDDDDNDKPVKDKARKSSRVKSKMSAASIRRAERDRCAAIFAHPGAAHNPTLAAELAFNTDLPATAAAALLAASPAPAARQGLSARMAKVPAIKVGADAAEAGTQTEADEARALASRIIASARASGIIRS